MTGTFLKCDHPGCDEEFDLENKMGDRTLAIRAGWVSVRPTNYQQWGALDYCPEHGKLRRDPDRTRS